MFYIDPSSYAYVPTGRPLSTLLRQPPPLTARSRPRTLNPRGLFPQPTNQPTPFQNQGNPPRARGSADRWAAGALTALVHTLELSRRFAQARPCTGNAVLRKQFGNTCVWAATGNVAGDFIVVEFGTEK